MKILRIVLPDQLSVNNPVYEDLTMNDHLLFYEPMDSFYEINHHKQKIVLLLSSMRKIVMSHDHKNIIHMKLLKNNKHTLASYLKSIIKEYQFNKIVISKPSDFKTNKDLMFFCQSSGIELEVLSDSKFISSSDDFSDWSSDKKTRIQEYYYRWLRKKYNIFMTAENKPEGDKWNFDKDNRAGISKLKSDIPSRTSIKPDQIVFDTMVDVEECFPNSTGSLENFNWATTHKDAEKLLDDFLERYF